jgi:hypothetical protein
VADIWGFDESTEKPIRVFRRKPKISATAKERCKSLLRERLQETPEPHSSYPIVSPGLRAYGKIFYGIDAFVSTRLTILLSLWYVLI